MWSYLYREVSSSYRCATPIRKGITRLSGMQTPPMQICSAHRHEVRGKYCAVEGGKGNPVCIITPSVKPAGVRLGGGGRGEHQWHRFAEDTQIQKWAAVCL